MNIFSTKFAKLAILGGCGLRILVPCLSMLEFLFSISFSILSNIINVIAFLLIAGGFALLFLLEQKFIDLAIGGLFGLSVFSIIIYFWMYRFLPYSFTMISSVLSGFCFLIAIILWAFKLNKNSNRLAALAIMGSYAVSFFAAIIVPLIHLPSFLLILSYIASNAALAFGAFLDYNS